MGLLLIFFIILKFKLLYIIFEGIEHQNTSFIDYFIYSNLTSIIPKEYLDNNNIITKQNN
jgi:hypothetical protein